MNDIVTATNRFGLGARPRDRSIRDARGWLTAQLAAYRPGLPATAAIAPRTEIITKLADQRAETRAAKAGGPADAAPMESTDPAMAAKQKAVAEATGLDPAQRAARLYFRNQLTAQVATRGRMAVASDAPFVERLVFFWANHFTAAATRANTVALGGLLEFDAIRPHVLGRFEDMLLAAERHPAMLIYLDQAQSIGPESPLNAKAAAAGRRVPGLNENLGREILELHTLGVRSAYGQADVTELARALTGWTVAGFGRGPAGQLAPVGNADFMFVDGMHQPGARTILGKTYPAGGEAQARAILIDLARHPATAHHIATKLARHFAADDPPPALVAKLEQSYLKSGGDLAAVYATLIDAPEAWAPGRPKFRTPWEWSIALFRSIDGAGGTVAAMSDQDWAGLPTRLGQPTWKPDSPAGYDDIAASWAGPDALFRRVEMSTKLAQMAPDLDDPRALAQALFGDTLSPATARVIAGAESKQQGLALLFVSPEMLGR